MTRLHERLAELNATVSVAESLTGGLVLATLTATPGASSTVRGGVVVYATDLKITLAGVSAELLAEQGAVTDTVALQLASGVRERLDSTYGVGVTGVAGPELQDGIAVGTVFVAVAGPQRIAVREYHFDGDRAEIRAAAVQASLELLAEECASTS